MSKLDEKAIVIIGGGPAGYKSALEIRKQFSEQEIILIEKNKLGGACLHVGCIPSKQLHSIKNLDDYAKSIKKNKMILEKGIASELKNANVRFINAEAKILENDQVEAEGETIDYSHLIVATGTQPRTLSDLPNALTSDSFFSEENIKKGFSDKYCFIGGGYIGVELASMLAHHGKKVRIIEMLDEILIFLDDNIREKLKQELKKSGIEILTGIQDLKDAEIQDDEAVFVSIGRLPNIETSEFKGKDNIHILGDANQELALAHYAYAQARALAYKFAGKDYPEINKRNVPLVIFSHPEVASIGWSLKEAKAEFGEDAIESIEINWASNGKARISGHERGMTQWIIEKSSQKILGCNIIGQNASDLISIIVPIVNQGLSIEDTKHWIYPHPTIGEIFAF